jgi:Spy/CpxP family protein refolding chaperone
MARQNLEMNMTDTRFRLVMGFFLCTAIGLLTLSELSVAQPRDSEPKPGCMAGPHNDFAGLPPPPFGAQHGGPARHAVSGKDGLPPHLQQLDLSESQQDQIFALNHEQIPLVREQMKIADKARDTLHQLAQAKPFDKAKAQSVAQTQADAMAKVAVLRAEMEASVRSLLTPEQLEKLDTAKPCARQPK